METGSITLKAFASATAGVLIIEGITRWVVFPGYFSSLWGTGLARLLGIAWLVLVISRSPQGWARMGLTRNGWVAGLRRGLFWSAGFGAMAGAGFIASQLMGIDLLPVIGPEPAGRRPDQALFFLVGGLVAPAAEELYFRGILYGFLRRWGFLMALVVSTLIFTMMHPGLGGVPITQIVGGLVFAAAYEIEKNLLVPVVIHVLGNLAIFSLPYVLY